MLIPDAPAVQDMAESMPTVPEATYNLRVHKAEYVATPKSADAKGPYIKAQFIITGPGEGNHVGRLVFENLSVTGKGTFKLRELLSVTGHAADFKLQDTDQILGLEFNAAVVIEKSPGYADKNVVKRFMPLSAVAV